MKQYLILMEEILNEGSPSTNRTGTPDLALFGRQYRIPLSQDENGIIHGFPLLTTKRVSLKNIFIELMWKLSGSTNIRPLVEQKVHIWTEWPFKEWIKHEGKKVAQFTDDSKNTETDEWKELLGIFEKNIINDDVFAERFGSLGFTYGHNFRHFGSNVLNEGGQDQAREAIMRIINKPDDRRIIINLWDPVNEKNTLLPPCPCFYQFNARQDGYLDLQLYQRSCDYFLGVPYNTAQDTLMLCMFAHVAGRKPRNFIHTFGDVHLYNNHHEQARIQLGREPGILPSLKFNREVLDIHDFKWEDISILNYDPHPPIKGNVAV